VLFTNKQRDPLADFELSIPGDLNSIENSVALSLLTCQTSQPIFKGPLGRERFPNDGSMPTPPPFDMDNLDEDLPSWISSFSENGFTVQRKLIPEDLLNEIRMDMDFMEKEKFDGFEFGSSNRIEQAHKRFDSIERLVKLPEITDLLTKLFGSTPQLCQTLVFQNGSEQSAHQDTIHLTPFPSGYMCGVWFAIDDVQPGSGELFYYPGSHRLDRVFMRDFNLEKVEGDWTKFTQTISKRWDHIIQQSKFGKRIFQPEAGTVLIWHENLMHGGLPRSDQTLRRRSVVAHYFASGTIAYYDSRGLPGHMLDSNITWSTFSNTVT
jgi:hypothetical protein